MEGIEQVGHVFSLNGITFEFYSMAKELWNWYHGVSADSLQFFDFCLRKWDELRPLYHLSQDRNLSFIFAEPYNYYRDIVIVGAQSELERLRGRWPSTSAVSTETVRFLRAWRIHVASEYTTEPLALDLEREYYVDADDHTEPGTDVDD